MYSGMNVPPLAGGLPPYATDFRDNAVGSEISASGWTKRTGNGGGLTGLSASSLEATVSANATSLSGRRVLIDHDVADHVYGVTFDDIPSTTTDCQILALVQWTVTASSDYGGSALILRANSTCQDGYNACPNPFGDIASFEINELIGGYRRGSGGSGAGDSATATLSTSTRYWVRFQMIGTTFKAKVWAYGSAEPTSWKVSTTDSTRTSGYVGLMVVNPAEPFYCEYFSVGLGSATAPFPNG